MGANLFRGKLTISPQRTFQLYVWLYLGSYIVLLGWVLLLLIGFISPSAMTLANQIAIPTVFGSVICLALFKWLARRAGRDGSKWKRPMPDDGGVPQSDPAAREKWRYWYSWALFYAGAAVIVYFTVDNWTTRILGFLWLTIPLTIWAKHRVARSR